jgi:hypothetical protein
MVPAGFECVGFEEALQTIDLELTSAPEAINNSRNGA